MRVLFLCPAVAPLVRDGGVAEGITGLSRALARVGCEVTIAVPLSRALDLAQLAWREPDDAREGDATRMREADLGGGVRLLVIDASFSPPESAWGCDSGDAATAEHFAAFCRAVVAHVDARAAAGAPYTVVHAHDWPAAPVLALLAARTGSRPATFLTIHNLAFQGIFDERALPLGLHPRARAAFAFHGRINFLQAGIASADAVLTVSPTYAREIVTPQFGELLHPALAARGAALRGVVNGIDTDLWDPARDPHLPARYDAADPSGKRACKRALLAELGLEGRDAAPLAVSLGRIEEQKGSDVLASALTPLTARDVTVLVAGRGDRAMTDAMARAARDAAPHARFLGYVGEPLAHRLIAAADLVLMPSRFEPCGVVQMYAQRYGALPVARRVGGLIDTLIDLDTDPARGTGILFDRLLPDALVDATLRGVSALRSPAWPAIERRLLALPLGWVRAAVQYRILYGDVAKAQFAVFDRAAT